jgi:hypothetical protein
MLTLAETAGDRYLSAPRIAGDEVQLLWPSDYWDGPLSGLLVFRGERCWFQNVAENEDFTDPAAWYRRFVVLRLTSEQLEDELYWHDLFRKHVGTHTDYGAERGEVLPREQHRHFYDAYRLRKPPDYSDCEVLGWFER